VDEAEAVTLATASEYGLSLGILTRDVMKGLDLAERIPQVWSTSTTRPVNDEAIATFRRRLGLGHRVPGSGGANLEAFTETR